MRLAAKLMVGALAIVLVVALLSPVALYLYGLTLLPADRDPEDPARVPPIARTLLWRELGGEAPPKLPVLNPYTHFTEPNGPRMNLAVGAGRSLLVLSKYSNCLKSLAEVIGLAMTI
jgi:hypothetical protein